MTFHKICVVLAVTVALFAVVFSDEFTTITAGNLVLDVSDFELPWAEALESCRSINKTLLTIESAEKDKVIVDLFVNGGANVTLPGNNSWIAATEQAEGVWKWATVAEPEPLFYTRWFIGQPDDLTSLNCAYQAVRNMLYWRDANCSAPMFFVCESTM